MHAARWALNNHVYSAEPLLSGPARTPTMFMSKDELSDDEEMGGDVVVPLSLVASTPQVVNMSRPGAAPIGAGDEAPGNRSAQYNERLRRARALNEQKRKVSCGGAPETPHCWQQPERRAESPPLGPRPARCARAVSGASEPFSARPARIRLGPPAAPRAHARHARRGAQAAW